MLTQHLDGQVLRIGRGLDRLNPLDAGPLGQALRQMSGQAASEQISLRRQDIMQAADIRALMPGTALLLAIGARPALITLRPWYSGPDAVRIADATRQAEQAMRQGARRTAGLPADPGEGA